MVKQRFCRFVVSISVFLDSSLSYLVRKIKEPNVVNVIRELTLKMIQISNENMCGICAIGLKTIITDTALSENGVIAILIKEIPQPLIELMAQAENGGLHQMEAFDIMSEIITRWEAICDV